MQTTIVGVTGTDGKTTVVEALAGLASLANRSCLSISSLGVKVNRVAMPIDMASWVPDAQSISYEIKSLIRDSLGSEQAFAIIEIPSYWLSLGVHRELDITVAVITSLGHDHLDIHQSLENYHQLKFELLDCAELGFASKQVGDRLDYLGLQSDTLTCLQEKVNATSIRDSNLALAYTVGESLGLELDYQDLVRLPRLPGRFEMFEKSESSPRVIVDSAHTPESIAQVLNDARNMLIHSARLFAIGGAGGDRDSSKRKWIGQAMYDNADITIVTDDNARFEEPATIRRGVLEGAQEAYEVERRDQALLMALAMANADDVIVMLGLGDQECPISQSYPGDRAFLMQQNFKQKDDVRCPN